MKKILILAIIAAMLSLPACGKEAVNQNEPVTQVTEQGSEPESNGGQGGGTEESLGEPGSPDETSGQENRETKASGEKQETEAAGREASAVSGEPGSSEKEIPDSEKAEAVTGKPSEAAAGPSETASKPVSTSKPSNTAKPANTPKPSGGDSAKQEVTQAPAASTPAPHTSCTWDGGTVTTAATCSSEGVKTYTCTVCGNTRTESIAAAGHSYTTESKAATCTENGYTKTYCTTCGNVQSESTQSATGHTLQEEWFHEPTCTYEGVGHCNACTKCDYYEDLPEGALGHVSDAGTVYRAGTCTRTAKISHKCTRCGCNLEDTEGAIDPNNHDWCIDPEDGVEYCAECGLEK